MHSVDTETRHGPGSYLRTLENRIRERAHEIWTAHGCIDGQADQHWLAAEHEILMESTASLPGVQQKRRFRARSKNSVWRCELRIKFFGMLFGVGIAAVGAAAFSLGAHHDGSAPASPGPIRETAAPASAPEVGAEVTASKRVEATSVDTDRASTESDVAREWTNVPETAMPATSVRPALEHTKPVASERSAAAADRPDTKLGRPYGGDGSSAPNAFGLGPGKLVL